MPRPVREVSWLEQRNGVYNVRWCEPPTEEAKRRNRETERRLAADEVINNIRLGNFPKSLFPSGTNGFNSLVHHFAQAGTCGDGR
jgi:hypothetical protein